MNAFGVMQKMKGRSEVEHIILFSGIILAVIRCLCSDKLINMELSTINSYIVAVSFLITIAAIIKILYQLQFTNFSNKCTYRDHGDKGLFCIILLPTALIFTCINHWSLLPNEYKFLTLVSIELSLSSFIVLSLCRLHQNYFNRVIFAVVASTVLTNGMLSMVGTYSLKCVFLSLLSKCLFFWLLDAALVFSQSFTMGELNLVCQLIVMFLVSALMYFNSIIYYDKMYPSNANSMIFIALTGLFAFLFLLRIFPVLRSTLYFYIVFVGIGSISILATMSVVFKKNPFLWFVNYISETNLRLLLTLHFGVCSGLTFLFILWQQNKFGQCSTVARKFFHGVVVAIYIPGILFDADLLLLASSLIFGIFVSLECIRLLNIFPLGDLIQNAFYIFLDEKDSGMLMLTHLYLFLGCSIPLWIHPFHFNEMNCMCLVSGILALGFGDSAASIAGTYFGKHKWPHTKKSYEGTVSAFIIQFLATLFLFVKFVPSLFDFLFILLATAHSVLLETFTIQVDNLILPFYLYIMLICL